MEGEHAHVAQRGTALSNHEWPYQGWTQGGSWELSPHSTHVSLGWRRAPWSYGAPVFVVMCRPTSAHLGSELLPSGSLNEFSGGLGVTVQILPGGVFKMTATPCLCGERHGTRLGSPPTYTSNPTPPPAVLGSRDPAMHREGTGEHDLSAGPASRGRPTASEITTAQTARNVFGLIFGIAVGNRPGQM